MTRQNDDDDDDDEDNDGDHGMITSAQATFGNALNRMIVYKTFI